MLKKMQLCIYQFCVVKPLVSLILAVLETVGVRQPGVIDAGSVFLSMVKATSLTISAHMTTQWAWGLDEENARFLNRNSSSRVHCMVGARTSPCWPSSRSTGFAISC